MFKNYILKYNESINTQINQPHILMSETGKNAMGILFSKDHSEHKYYKIINITYNLQHI